MARWQGQREGAFSNFTARCGMGEGFNGFLKMTLVIGSGERLGLGLDWAHKIKAKNGSKTEKFHFIGDPLIPICSQVDLCQGADQEN